MRALPPTGVLLIALFVLSLTGPLTGEAHGEPEWTTYHRDPVRSGADPDAVEPLAPSFAWQSVNFGAPIWGQPLVLGSRVYVATVGDNIYALEASTGEVVWQKSLGTPVPSNALPCGDIVPTVGIVGTPVIDKANDVIYTVADTWYAATKEAKHILKGLRLANGEEVLSVPVDPPGADPKALLQRTALNLDRGRIIFGFGGNDGDCSDYRGTVVSAQQSGGGQPLFWQVPIAPPSSSGGAVWGVSGPAVDSSGYVYASTGNPNPPGGENATVYDYSDSLVRLDPAHDFVVDPALESVAPFGFFEPPSWLQDSNSDTDLGSAGPELLPGGLIFQAGKNGLGYLIGATTMGSGAPAVYSSEVCGGNGSFGGDAYAEGVIYIPCTNGVQALAYNEAACTFTPLWQGPSNAFGPPIVAGGVVWALATGGFKGGGKTLYGLDPATGLPRYTVTLPSPIADHFASPSAAGGRLFVATGSTVSAYQIARLSSGGVGPPETTATVAGCLPSTSPPASPGGGTSAKAPSGPSAPGLQHTASRSLATVSRPFTRVRMERTRLRVSAGGRVRIVLRCPAAAGDCRGTIRLHAEIDVARGRGPHHSRHLVIVPLEHARFGLQHSTILLALRLDGAARALLRRHRGHVALSILIAEPGRRAREAMVALT
jgi:outer membrane protein assembly factor BamB